jgi:hypothetical protein
LSLWGEDAGGKRMTLEEYIKEQRERVANMTLAQARQIVANHYGHDDMRIECEKAVWMLLNCADEKINGGWIPVTERLPEEMFGCLVTVWDANPKTGEEFENILPEFAGYDGETWNGADGKPIAFEVVAWMPLPKPYKGGE